MPRVVTKSCLGKKHCKCAEVCPVDCFYDICDPEINQRFSVPFDNSNPRNAGMLMINPDECIDCGACQGECPENAIYEEGEVPVELQEFVKLNRRRTTSLGDAEKDRCRCSGI